MILVGLTGSIGMGKSATAEIFRSEGAPVYDSDRLVHEIYAGAAAQEIEKAFPGSTREGAVDRSLLSRMVLNDPEAMKRLEAIVHPLVWEGRRKFLEEQERLGQDVAVLDIPLLFETGSEKDVDKIVVVTAPKSLQRERVLARPNMTEEKFEAILARQTPDEEKRRRADFIIHTDKGFDAAREEVRAILRALRPEKEGNC
ncbi:dephospho-CoA kinase [Methylocystis heyeri]|uniref:Dephospho-CoA kinase n=1 Tax=Methylocystis heyeri TaxID=391905 RepID=A0A6B8KKE7_9HYPH|nr:dephospho-CoA kinase [Methylocystis heyeri]QGM47083.1 dephospho-CoA kinase [Methylocystis heyeri]